ncbi:anaerobic glycerol-3-phosphate dehydrogenase subunit GlpB [Desulfosporosinus sp. PR]|uniref:anaerobic glycerol-3-phosphate dehydrogenase subunit GlpB n=1 Tax=Candidatus Desulfosporosinus nitrosoreducens TaxID=3401928 RepID=UPI0027F91788|nr:anaerobic glycerol-3-phosphate dehydrogenase subunit GlpB [Desulfosporosinus sp. PR]MDQ7093084.1 anaerobic glycerol-3-phosphate dehydrogenase subunit GlpB [Desulfosporosinus sp. PR]
MWDGIIVGGGLAGLLTGIRASERGKRVLIISEGVGSLSYSSGVLDFGEVERLVKQEKHPYALLGESRIRAGAQYFQNLFPEYIGKWGKSQDVLTPLGSPRKAGLVPRRFAADVLRDARQIILVAPEGLKDFYPEVSKGILERDYPLSNVVLYPIRPARFEPWYQGGKAVTGVDYVRFWRTESGTAELSSLAKGLVAQVSNAGTQGSQLSGTVVVFPGLVSEFSSSLEQVVAEISLPLVEMTAFPPSASGGILYEVLKQKFKALGGELLVGAGVKAIEAEGKLCRKVIVSSKGRDSCFSAQSFVLATGGIFGGGIKVTPSIQQETVLGLPLFVPSHWTRPEFLGEQPYAQMGVEVDCSLRPLNPQSQEVIFENVRIVGRMLAHYDPWIEQCGGGVSLASGWFAGDSI